MIYYLTYFQTHPVDAVVAALVVVAAIAALWFAMQFLRALVDYFN